MNGQPEEALKHMEVHDGWVGYKMQGLALAHHDLGDLETSQIYVDQLVTNSVENDNGWPYGLARMFGWPGIVARAKAPVPDIEFNPTVPPEVLTALSNGQ